MKSPKTTNNQKHTITLVFMFIAVVLIWALSAVFIYIMSDDWSTRGTMGDLFGAVNALFSGLAFAALIYTIILQQEEIRMNRSEIELNRKELKKSASAQQHSQEALKDQVKQTALTAKEGIPLDPYF